tara:strand:- start:252 stop:509 length:258 start_codon:yes stop_codon:yes gene_type:complete
MPGHTDEKEMPSEPEPEMKKEPAKAKRTATKMTDKQKADLNKHMEKMKKGGMSASEMKSHRMKMMGRMRKGMSVKKSHDDIMKTK